MPIIKDSDLFDFDGYSARMRALEADTESFAQSQVNWINRTRAAYQAAEAEARQLGFEIDRISVTQKDAATVMATYANRVDTVATKLEIARQSEKDLTEAQKLNAQVITDLTTKLESLQKRYNALDPSQKDYAKQQRAILNEVRTVTRAIDAQSRSLQVGKSVIDAAEGSVNHLKKQTTELKKTLDALPNAYDRATGKINEQNRAAVALNEQYQKNIALLNKVEQGQRVFNRNVGNYPQQSSSQSIATTALSMGTRFAGAGLALAGIDSTLTAIQKVGEITLQFDSLDSALKVVSNDTALFTRRQEMLSKISDDLGQDLAVVEKNYTNLTASSKGTRLEGQATDDIFKSITGTMGRLKKPSEDTERALNAIGQMMSKGTVQSEELRGQLGDVLPGAFGIAARAMGVTSAKLSDMLKNGEVVASDFLPKFAQELERTFNPNHEQRVEGLAANLARMRNEAVEWVKSMDIGDTAGRWIGNITSMARSLREFFGPAVLESTRHLADQNQTVNQLESALPGLMARYDELKGKSKLSADEQKELQTVINSIANLAPSAATAFDGYGNALDINKSKVMAFTQAQRELNAELNKQAISDLQRDAGANMATLRDRQNRLNYGRELKGSFARLFSRSDNRYQDLSDNRRKELQGEVGALSQKAIADAHKIISMGGTLTGELRSYVENSSNYSVKQLLVVDDYNRKIAEKQAIAADLFQKGAFKQREVVVKEIKKLQGDLNQIINPTTPTTPTGNDKPGQSEAAINKARREAEQRLRDALSLSKASSDRNLGRLSDDRQDGLVTEQTFIEQRLQITLKGLNERQLLLEKAGKKETDDYINVLKEKEKADTEYKRAQLQLDLKSIQNGTNTAIASLDVSHNDGEVTDAAYVEKRHKIIQNGLDQEMIMLKEAGQEGSELYRQANQRQLDEQADYYRRRAKVEQEQYKKELAETKDALKEVNRQTAMELDDRLRELDDYYRKKEQKVQLDVKLGKLTPVEGETQIHALRMDHLNEELAAVERASSKDRELSSALLDDKIAKFKAFVADSTHTEKEISDTKQALRELEQVRDQQAADDKKALDKAVAQNSKDQDDETTQHKLTNAEKLKKKNEELLQMSLQLAGTIGDATFSILASNNERESQALDRQHDEELRLAGDNADAKTRIEEQYQKRKAELARKAAIAEREQALFSIAVNTAMGVASVLSTGGGTHYADLGISAGILTAFVIAAGLAQAAAVLAKPLPAFAGGKLETDTYAGPALAGEAGAELFVDREGYSQLLTGPTVIHTKPGDRIYTADETAAILADSRSYGVTADRLRQGRLSEKILIQQSAGSHHQLTEKGIERAVGKALDNRPVNETILDEHGIRRGQRRGNSREEYLEKRHRW